MKTNKIKVVAYKCSNCGAVVGEGDNFCRMCGNKFSDTVVAVKETVEKVGEIPDGVVTEEKSCVLALSPLIENN